MTMGYVSFKCKKEGCRCVWKTKVRDVESDVFESCPICGMINTPIKTTPHPEWREE